MNPQTIRKKYGFKFPFKPDPLAAKAFRYCKGKRLLDVGCGEGTDSAFFAQKKKFKITAFDVNREYLNRFRAYRRDQKLSNISILERSATTYSYPPNTYDVINCLLVICCMKRSQFERIIGPLKRSVKPGGIIIMSSRNYLDPELKESINTKKAIEPNTFRRKEDCCQFIYFMERNRLREVFHDFEILYYYEGFVPCKYNQHPKHGDSHIICRRRK